MERVIFVCVKERGYCCRGHSHRFLSVARRSVPLLYSHAAGGDVQIGGNEYTTLFVNKGKPQPHTAMYIGVRKHRKRGSTTKSCRAAQRSHC